MPTSEPPAERGADRRQALGRALSLAIELYLAQHPTHLSWVATDGPLLRAVGVNPETWLPWLRDGTRPGRRSAYQVHAANSDPAVALLDDPRLRRDNWPPDRVCIDRPLLADLARSAAGSGDGSAMVQLFVATMMWGSGTTNGRGPRRTAEALSDAALPDVLRRTSEEVRRGDLRAAHERFEVKGVGEAFFTKWLWAASLDGPVAVRPLILDLRVRSVLYRILGKSHNWARPLGSAGYVDFVITVHAAAELLAAKVEHIDAEKLEWLLFDRANHDTVAEACLNDATPV